MIVLPTAPARKLRVVPDFPVTRGIGFRFTPEENLRMHLHCYAAARFMASFGNAPAQPEIDLSHYENTLPHNGK